MKAPLTQAQAQEVKEAMEAGANERRSRLKHVLTELVTKTDKDVVAKTMSASRLVGPNANQLNISESFTGFKDSISPLVMVDIIARGDKGLHDACEAILNPSTESRPDDSKTGYTFGRHKDLGVERQKENLDHINTLATDGDMPMSIETDNIVAIIDAVDICITRMLTEQSEQAKEYGIDVDESDINAARDRIFATMELTPEQRAGVIAANALREEAGKSRTLAEIEDAVAKGIFSREAFQLADKFAPVTSDEDDSKPLAPVKSKISLNPSMAAAVNSVLEVATSGECNDIAKVFEEREALSDEVDSLTKALAVAKSAPSVAMPTKVEKDGDIPEGEVVWKMASEIFKVKGGRKDKMLDFEIPTFVWDGTHPDVPELDEDYIFNGKQLFAFLWGVVDGEFSWLYGMPGTGKSTFVQQVAARTGFPCYRINMDANIERPEFVGNRDLMNDGGVTVTEFKRGVLPTAMEKPCFLLLDEADYMRPDIAPVLQRVLEGQGLALMEEGDKVIYPHPLFRLVATANTRGQGDELGCYPGVRTLNSATIDRFTVWLEFDYLTAAKERDLLMSKAPGLTKEVAEKIVDYADKMREAFKTGQILIPCSPRSLMSLAKKIVKYGQTADEKTAIKMAVDTTIINKAPAEFKQGVAEIAKRVVG